MVGGTIAAVRGGEDTGDHTGDDGAGDDGGARPPAPPDTPFARAVHDVVASIPPGSVMSYGEVAAEAGKDGSPFAARAVGQVLARSDGTLPWWRVVNAHGRLVPGHEVAHRRWLEAEGVEVDDRGVVAMRRRRR